MLRDLIGRPAARTPEDLEGVHVAIIGAPYVATTHDAYAVVSRDEWLSAPKRVRQQSARYQSGYMQKFGLDVFDILPVVDYGDALIREEVMRVQSAENILDAQRVGEEKAGQVPSARSWYSRARPGHRPRPAGGRVFCPPVPTITATPATSCATPC